MPIKKQSALTYADVVKSNRPKSTQRIEPTSNLESIVQNMMKELMRNQALILQTILEKNLPPLQLSLGYDKMELQVFFSNSGINILHISEAHLTAKYNFIISSYKL